MVLKRLTTPHFSKVSYMEGKPPSCCLTMMTGDGAFGTYMMIFPSITQG
jgi:hypothetical protein